MKQWLPIAGIIALLLLPSNAFAQRQVLAYDSIDRMAASEIGSEFPTPYVVVLVNGLWTEWRWFAGDTTAADGTTILESTSRRGRLGRWRLMPSSGGSGGSGGDGIWTNSAGVVQLVTQTNLINFVGPINSGVVNGHWELEGTGKTEGWDLEIVADTNELTVVGYDLELYKNGSWSAEQSTGLYIYSEVAATGYGPNVLYGDSSGSYGISSDCYFLDDTGNFIVGGGIASHGIVRSFQSEQLGGGWVAVGQKNGQTNVGTASSAIVNGKTGVFVGGYDEIASTTGGRPTYTSAVRLIDNRDSGLPPLVVKDESIEAFKVDENGNTIVSGKLDVKTNITFNGTTPVIISGGATYGNARGAGSLDVQASRNAAGQVASGAGAVAGGIQGTASGANSVVWGYNNTASAANSTAIGQNGNASASEALAVGYAPAASASRTIAIGYAPSASALGAMAIGSATSDVSYTANLSAPIMNWKSEVSKGGNSTGAAGDWKFYSGTEVVLMSQEVDLETTQDYTNSFPASVHFFPNEVGVIITSANTVSGQPSLSFGTQGNTTKILGATATTGLTAAYKRHRYTTLLTSEGETGVTASVTTGATATTLLGRFYWKGLLVRDQ